MITLKTIVVAFTLLCSLHLRSQIAAPVVVDSVPSTQMNGTNWMPFLPDSLLVSSLTIPGTHNSAARFGCYAKCQTWNISEQLDHGIRFFDLRFAQKNDRLHLFHGPFDQHILFDSILKNMTSFLKSHPSETIVLRITEQERPPKNCQYTFVQLWEKAISQQLQWMFTGTNEFPKLSDLRGKIYVMGQSIVSNGTKYGQHMFIQDEYQIALFGKHNLRHKLSCIQQHSLLKNICWSLNYCSGTGIPFRTPKRIANTCNQFVSEQLKQNPSFTSGIIVLDFPTDELLSLLIRSNFQA